jgi:hypothetical protein
MWRWPQNSLVRLRICNAYFQFSIGLIYLYETFFHSFDIRTDIIDLVSDSDESQSPVTDNDYTPESPSSPISQQEQGEASMDISVNPSTTLGSPQYGSDGSPIYYDDNTK